MALTREKQQLAYLSLRYAPNPLTEDGIYLGVVIFDPANIEDGFCKVRFAADWQKAVSRFDSDADVEVLDAICRDIDLAMRKPQSRAGMLNLIEDSFSHSLRASHRQRFLTSNPNESFNDLVRRLEQIANCQRSRPD